MKLTIEQRFHLMAMLPAKANMLTLATANEIMALCRPTEEETKELKIQFLGNGSVTFDRVLDEPKEITFTASQMAFLKRRVSTLDAANDITQECFEVASLIENWKASK
jgi:hypothetical protein